VVAGLVVAVVAGLVVWVLAGLEVTVVPGDFFELPDSPTARPAARPAATITEITAIRTVRFFRPSGALGGDVGGGGGGG
jgi:hypothetical protein